MQKVLFDKLFLINTQWSQLSIIITDNAKIAWQTELTNYDYNKYEATYYEKNDIMSLFA